VPQIEYEREPLIHQGEPVGELIEKQIADVRDARLLVQQALLILGDVLSTATGAKVSVSIAVEES
jgi:hypothetical protein